MSERSEEALLRLPNKGQPSIGGDGMLREYRGVDASDLPDPGHRHSSGLWALYPGSQVSCGGVFHSVLGSGEEKSLCPGQNFSPFFVQSTCLFFLLLF